MFSQTVYPQTCKPLVLAYVTIHNLYSRVLMRLARKCPLPNKKQPCDYQRGHHEGFVRMRPMAQLTHWGRDKMAAIFQTTFSNAFSSMKMYTFRLRFHWSLFPRVQLTIFQHWFRLSESMMVSLLTHITLNTLKSANKLWWQLEQNPKLFLHFKMSSAKCVTAILLSKWPPCIQQTTFPNARKFCLLFQYSSKIVPKSRINISGKHCFQ